MKTQQSSAMRVQHDILGDNALKTLYDAYRKLNDGFEYVCLDIINDLQSPNVKKQALTRAVKDARLKGQKLAIAQNAVLAGMGLGV